jgi:hypothetical protein
MGANGVTSPAQASAMVPQDGLGSALVSTRPTEGEQGWAEAAVEDACRLAAAWYQQLPAFEPRVNLRSVVGFKHPALLSEQDCVIHFARFLNEAGVPWDAIHHQVAGSRWLYDAPHPAAPVPRWKVDLALLTSEDFLAAELPAREPGFQFDAFLEFKYLTDYWVVEGARVFGRDPVGGRERVRKDVEKMGGYLASGVCRAGYVVVFEECNWGFTPDFISEAQAQHGCRIRLIRGYSGPE